MSIPFTKLHGLGNDFVLIDDLGKPPGLCSPVDAELARRMLDRRLGIGGDQLLWIKSPHGADHAFARMEIFNPDGSIAEMCGNGIRAAALYLYRHGPKRQPEYAIETLAGLIRVWVEDGVIRADMGCPQIADPAGEEISVAGRKLRFVAVDMGNPHAVFFVDSTLKMDDIERLGSLIERHPRFVNRTNVEFVFVEKPHAIRVRVWERGAGFTLACGTGACAAAVAALSAGRVQGKVEVRLPGGSLWVTWDGGASPVLMEGPAVEVFRGQFLV